MRLTLAIDLAGSGYPSVVIAHGIIGSRRSDRIGNNIAPCVTGLRNVWLHMDSSFSSPTVSSLLEGERCRHTMITSLNSRTCGRPPALGGPSEPILLCMKSTALCLTGVPEKLPYFSVTRRVPSKCGVESVATQETPGILIFTNNTCLVGCISGG